jgi:very-short-patch-repair endonuclease
VVGFWAALPAGRVVRLTGASPDAIASVFEPVPDDAPAVVLYRAQGAVSSARAVARVLDRLEVAALDLYPSWLPGAETVVSPGGSGVAAVRALALQRASGSPHFGPFLADLAARSLSGRSRTGRFPAEIRAAGLARVFADSYHRSRVALLVQPPDGPDPAGGDALIVACEWLAHHGGFSVWLSGDWHRAGGRIPAVSVRLSTEVVDSAATDGPEAIPPTPVVRLPALAGAPHPASRAEGLLEAALAKLPWAAGRVWNRTFRADPLTNPIRVDLMWPEERCAVEIDGDEHRAAQHYEDDRRRDVLLQFAGFAVLRYTNAQIQADVSAVVSQLEQFIADRRLGRNGHVHR